MGEDLSLSLYGGSAPHVGCAVLAVPRPSLAGEGTSATVSTINCTGHKDDQLAGRLAHTVAAQLGVTVSCTAGVHVDDASPETIDRICGLVPALAEQIIQARKDQLL